MKIPVTYAEWCTLMDEVGGNPRDEEYLDVIANGTISWTSGVAERFVKLVTDMIRKRINAAQDAFQRQMKNSRGNGSIIQSALGTLGKEYAYAYRITKALPIPGEHRDKLSAIVQEQADQTQLSLEQSAKSDRTGHLTMLVKNARVNRMPEDFCGVKM